jgi:hypothetical protein
MNAKCQKMGNATGATFAVLAVKVVPRRGEEKKSLGFEASSQSLVSIALSLYQASEATASSSSASIHMLESHCFGCCHSPQMQC